MVKNLANIIHKARKEPTNLKHLEELTSRLQFSRLIDREGADYSEIKTEKGSLIVLGLFKNDFIAVARAFASKGTICPNHTHEDSVEWMCVYYGKIKVTFDCDKEDVIVEFLEDTWTLVITIPPDGSFPDAIKKL